MFGSFEIKTYPQLNFALGMVNAVFLAVCLVVAYFFVFTPQHVALIDKELSNLMQSQIGRNISIAVIACIWGWIATTFLRLHDCLHEPHFRKWRASYDADFILRALLSEIGGGISQDLFARAYHNRRERDKLMQKLFYDFVGDEADTAKGRRLFFYTVMWKYWSLALLDLYVTALLLGAAIYHIVCSTPAKPGFVLTGIITILICRVWSNRLLDEAHKITEDQITAIKEQHAAELKKAAISVATDMGL